MTVALDKLHTQPTLAHPRGAMHEHDLSWLTHLMKRGEFTLSPHKWCIQPSQNNPQKFIISTT